MNRPNLPRFTPRVAKATGSRQLKVNPTDKTTFTYTCATEECRTTVKEYGDTTKYPCGRFMNCDPHFQGTCPDCDAVRFVMDTWAIANQRRAALTYSAPEPVPPLTHAVIFTILRQMGITVKNVRELPDDWDPYKKMVLYCSLGGEEVLTEKSFVQHYKELPMLAQKQGQRPPIQFAGYNPATDDPMLACSSLRFESTQNELLKHIVCQAVADGVMNQNYINAVMENYGIVPAGHTHNELFTRCSGVQVADVYKVLQVRDALGDQGTEISLKKYKYSPLRIDDIVTWGGQLESPITFDHIERMSILSDGHRAAAAPTGQTGGAATGTPPGTPRAAATPHAAATAILFTPPNAAAPRAATPRAAANAILFTPPNAAAPRAATPGPTPRYETPGTDSGTDSGTDEDVEPVRKRNRN